MTYQSISVGKIKKYQIILYHPNLHLQTVSHGAHVVLTCEVLLYIIVSKIDKLQYIYSYFVKQLARMIDTIALHSVFGKYVIVYSVTK